MDSKVKSQKCYVDGKALYERIASSELFSERIQRIQTNPNVSENVVLASPYRVIQLEDVVERLVRV
jgi:hypothetical protein